MIVGLASLGAIGQARRLDAQAEMDAAVSGQNFSEKLPFLSLRLSNDWCIMEGNVLYFFLRFFLN